MRQHRLDELAPDTVTMRDRVDHQPVDVQDVGVLDPRHRTDQAAAVVAGSKPAQRQRTQLLDRLVQWWDAVVADQRGLHRARGVLQAQQPLGQVSGVGGIDRHDVHASAGGRRSRGQNFGTTGVAVMACGSWNAKAPGSFSYRAA